MTAHEAHEKIEDRLARWLLMADDRIDSDELPLTQGFPARMLEVRRHGVTVAIQELERKCVVSRKRGRILIIGEDVGTYAAPG